jgi:hypothetical protein
MGAELQIKQQQMLKIEEEMGAGNNALLYVDEDADAE